MAALTALSGCGDNANGDAYKHSLTSKAPYSVLQSAEFDLRDAPSRAYIYRPRVFNSEIDIIAFPAKNSRGYVVFTAKAKEGRVLSVPDVQGHPILLARSTLDQVAERGFVSKPVRDYLSERATS